MANDVADQTSQTGQLAEIVEFGESTSAKVGSPAAYERRDDASFVVTRSTAGSTEFADKQLTMTAWGFLQDRQQ